MNTQYSMQISYISAIDMEAPSAESDIDYSLDIVTEFKNKLDGLCRAQLSKDQKSRFVSPAVNMHQILGYQDIEEYQKFFKTIDRYKICSSGWNNAHSVAPSEQHIQSALLGAAHLILAGTQAPNAMLLDDGTIGAYWRKGKKYASIDFEVDGEHSWAGTDGERYWAGVWNPKENIPRDLMLELKSVYA